jgi:hypothetical protein
MSLNRGLILPAIAALAVCAAAPLSQGATFTLPVEGWVVHNGSSTVAGAATNDPTFTTGDNIVAMGTFPEIELLHDGDYLTFSTTLTMLGRSTPGANTLNTQLRVGLFDGPDGAIVASDTPNTGFIIEYTNGAAGGLIREQTSLIQTNPFTSPTNIGNASPADTDSIAGENPPPVLLTLTLTRNGGELDLTGQISGGNHTANYSVLGYSSATFPMNGPFNFNRVGVFLGDGVNSTSASLADANIATNVPEPGVCLLLGTATIGGLMLRRRKSLDCSPRGC